MAPLWTSGGWLLTVALLSCALFPAVGAPFSDDEHHELVSSVHALLATDPASAGDVDKVVGEGGSMLGTIKAQELAVQQEMTDVEKELEAKVKESGDEIEALEQEIAESNSQFQSLREQAATARQKVSELEQQLAEGTVEGVHATDYSEATTAFAKRIDDANARARQYDDNANVVAQWATDVANFRDHIILPESETNPAIALSSLLSSLSSLMNEAADIEHKAALTFPSLGHPSAPPPTDPGVENPNATAPALPLSPPSLIPPMGGKHANHTHAGVASFLAVGVSARQVAGQLEAAVREAAVADAAVDAMLVTIQAARSHLQFAHKQQEIFQSLYQHRMASLSATLSSLSLLSSLLSTNLPTICPNQCSKHGSCAHNQCACAKGYEGLDCSLTRQSSRVNATTIPEPKVGREEARRLRAQAEKAAAMNASAYPRTVFDFGKSTQASVLSDPLTCQHSFPTISVMLWVKTPNASGMGGAGVGWEGKGGQTLVSYATPSHDSEFLLWLDGSCSALYLWVNSVSRKDLAGVPVANFTHHPLCDGQWHHLAITWSGEVGETKAFLDKKFLERHWAAFTQETVKSEGHVSLGHNLVASAANTGRFGRVPDAFLGMMSDVFFVVGGVEASDVAKAVETDSFAGNAPYLHWSLRDQDGGERKVDAKGEVVADEGSMGVRGAVFGGEWTKAVERGLPCRSA